MSNIPQELRYTSSHSWVQQQADGSLKVGITDFAQNALGDIVFVQLPDVGENYQLDQQIGLVESVKTGSDIYAPITGKVVAINQAISDNPELINDNPYQAWLYIIMPEANLETNSLLTADNYHNLINE